MMRTPEVVRTDETGRPGHMALTPGALAYVDAFRAGLIPCRVEATHGPGSLTVRLTAPRPGYRRGELLTFTGNDRVARVVPRTAVYVRSGQYRIAGYPVRCYPAPGAVYTPEPDTVRGE